MMQTTMNEIKSSEILLAETSDKGIGIEVGYAKVLQIPVIYIRSSNVKHSTTISDISDYHINYENTNDLESQLNTILNKMDIN